MTEKQNAINVEPNTHGKTAMAIQCSTSNSCQVAQAMTSDDDAVLK